MKRFLVFLYTSPTASEAMEASTSFDSENVATHYAADQTWHTPFYGHVIDSQTGRLAWKTPFKTETDRRASGQL
jgi:hypothetical protein